MYKKYIFFSLILFSIYNYTSTMGFERSLARSTQFGQQTGTNNNFDLPTVERNLETFRRDLTINFPTFEDQQNAMYFYSLPSQTVPAEKMIRTPQEIAQQNAAASSGLFAKIRLTATAMIVGSELKLSLADTARHGRFQELAQTNIQQFARDLQDEVDALLRKFQDNNRKQLQITDEAFMIRTKQNKQTIHDLNDILANLDTIGQFLSDPSMQTALERSLQDIETSLQRQLEINKTTVERTMKESADIAKILADLPRVKQRLCCKPQQVTDLATLAAEMDAILNSFKR